jgi:hypothetical protein
MGWGERETTIILAH